MFLVVALLAVAIVSLRYANEIWHIAVALFALLAFIGAMISAVLDRGSRQAFAIGMLLAMTTYGVVFSIGLFRYNLVSGPLRGGGSLPTTRLLVYMYAGIQETRWFDRETGKEIPGFDPTRQTMARPLQSRQEPSERTFMAVGHAWWALLLGYLGGRFARFVYVRRTRDGTPLAAESS
jgi:hypothetical protein